MLYDKVARESSLLLVYLKVSSCPCSLQCLFCEKLFKDRTALKDHMRKKQHKKINPKNKEYDRFYVINYLVSLLRSTSLITFVENFDWNRYLNPLKLCSNQGHFL